MPLLVFFFLIKKLAWQILRDLFKSCNSGSVKGSPDGAVRHARNFFFGLASVAPSGGATPYTGSTLCKSTKNGILKANLDWNPKFAINSKATKQTMRNIKKIR